LLINLPKVATEKNRLKVVLLTNPTKVAKACPEWLKTAQFGKSC